MATHVEYKCPGNQMKHFDVWFDEMMKAYDDKAIDKLQLKGYIRSRIELDSLPVPMLLHCPLCNGRHIDKGEFVTKTHHTHACQHCGHTWRPAIVATVGVQFLPGFKDKTDQ